MRFLSLMLVVTLLMLNACSLRKKYIFPDHKTKNQNSNKIFENKRIPEYNPGGIKFYENKELFTQFMKDQKADENMMHNKYGVASKQKEEEYAPNLVDMFRKERERRAKESIVYPNIHDNIMKWWNQRKEFIETEKKFRQRKYDVENFVVAGIDLKNIEGSSLMSQHDISKYNDVMMQTKIDHVLDDMVVGNPLDTNSIIDDENDDMNKYLMIEDDEDEENEFDVTEDKPYW